MIRHLEKDFRRQMRFWCGLLLIVALQALQPARAEVKIKRLDQSQFPLITCEVLVTSPQSEPVLTLDRSNFAVKENPGSEERGVPPTEFQQPGQPLFVEIVIDYSGSMCDYAQKNDKLRKWEAAKKIALEIVDHLHERDTGAIVTFGGKHDGDYGSYRDHILVSSLTSDKASLRNAIEKLGEPLHGADTPMCAALEKALTALHNHDGRRVIFLLTDGKECSDLTAGHEKQALKSAIGAAKQEKVPFYLCGFGYTGDSDIDENAMRELSGQTGGSYMISPSAQDIQSTFSEWVSELHDTYRVTYRTSRDKQDGTDRTVQIVVEGHGTSDIAGYHPHGLYLADFDLVVFISILIVLSIAVAAPILVWRAQGGRTP